MEWKEFKSMWNRAYWHWVVVYSAISLAITAIVAAGLWIWNKFQESREDVD